MKQIERGICAFGITMAAIGWAVGHGGMIQVGNIAVALWIALCIANEVGKS